MTYEEAQQKIDSNSDIIGKLFRHRTNGSFEKIVKLYPKEISSGKWIILVNLVPPKLEVSFIVNVFEPELDSFLRLYERWN